MNPSKQDAGPLEHAAVPTVLICMFGLAVVYCGRWQTQTAEDFLVQRSMVVDATRAPLLRIRINDADERELGLLPSIGPKMAHRIVAYRRQYGAFGSWSDLEKVSGMGPTTIETIAPFCEIDPVPPASSLAADFSEP